MEISESIVKEVAALARLSLTKEEIHRYKLQLTSVIDFFSQLESVEIPVTAPEKTADSWERSDELLTSLTQEDVIRNAPISTGSSFTVPRIIESQ